MTNALKDSKWNGGIYERPVLTQKIAARMLDSACQKAKELGILINVAIVDDGANLKSFTRMDESPLLSGTIAQNKAYTAASFGVPTHDWYPMIKDEPSLLHGIVHTDRLVVFGGGIPIKLNGFIIGGIGVSGGTADQDINCASAGLKVFESIIKEERS
nr:heme-binding protein [Anaerobacillus isosaccharinicus]